MFGLHASAKELFIRILTSLSKTSRTSFLVQQFELRCGLRCAVVVTRRSGRPALDSPDRMVLVGDALRSGRCTGPLPHTRPSQDRDPPITGPSHLTNSCRHRHNPGVSAED
ncbi:unnamed protein product [Merluccius merluccius]